MKRSSKGWTRLFIVWCVVWLPLSWFAAEWIDDAFYLQIKSVAAASPLIFGTWLIGVLSVYLTWRIFWWVVDGFNTKGSEKDE